MNKSDALQNINETLASLEKVREWAVDQQGYCDTAADVAIAAVNHLADLARIASAVVAEPGEALNDNSEDRQ